MHSLTHSLVFGALAVTACNGLSSNESGNLSAQKTGSLSTTLAQRAAPDVELLRACGDGAPLAGATGALSRAPFLQQVTDRSALVVFRTTEPEPGTVDVTTPDGTAVASVAAEADPGAGNETQRVAHLEGLQPATQYCYSVRGITGSVGFWTAPEPGSTAPVRFAAFGDSGGGGADQRALLDQLGTVPFDFLVHTGDLAYDSGSESQLDRMVFREYGDYLRSFSLYPSVGNHDQATSGAAPYLSSFVLPDNGVRGKEERWYSFDWGNVHFVALDTEQIGASQAQWLDADLEANRLPWTIVYGHVPPYSSGEHGGSSAFIEHFVPILEAHRVPLVLSGHDHDYERTHVINGVTYVVTGGGGVGTRPVGASEFTAFSEAVIHLVFVEIVGDRLVLHAIDGGGREFDQAVIVR